MYVSFARIFFLILVWFICSQMTQPFFIVAGIISVWVAWSVAKRFDVLPQESLFTKLHQHILYVGWLMKEIMFAAIGVTKLIWQLKPRIRPQLFTTQSKLEGDLALSLYGNSITLTPGTICVDISEGGLMKIHALETAGRKDIVSHRMERNIP